MVFDVLATRPIVKKVISNSRFTGLQYKESAPEKWEVVYNSIDTKSFDPEKIKGEIRSREDIKSDTILLGFIGRLVPWKGLDDLLSVMETIGPKYPNLKLVVMAGEDASSPPGYAKSIRERMQSIKLKNSVIDLGFQKDVRPFLKDFHMLIVPSKEPEPFGRVVIEAMALGVPVLVSNHGGAPEILEDEKYGYTFSPNDNQDLQNKIETLIQDRAELENMSVKVKQHVRDQFSKESLAPQVWSQIQSVLEKD